MMNFISPINHTESALSGSTVSAMIKRTKELGLDYFAMADQGTMLACLKSYMKATSKGVKPILGVEIYFKDKNCDIIANTPAENIKYFTLALHAKDQDAYQALVKMVSEDKDKVQVGEQFFNLYNFEDLQNISKYNITVTTTDVESIVAKPLLVGRADISVKYYQKLKDIFGDKFHPSLITYPYDKYWNALVRAEIGGITVDLPVDSMMATDRFNKAKVAELAGNHRHSEIKQLTINGVNFNVKPSHNKIGKASIINVFSDLPGGDVNANANKLILSLAMKHGDLDRILLSSYSFYAGAGDKVVQDMKLGSEKRFSHKQHMRTSEEAMEYLKSIGVKQELVEKFIQNTHNWANLFSEFKLDYTYRLPNPETDNPEKKLMEIIKEVGRMKWDDSRYTEQLKEEFKLLSQNGVVNLIPYFLPIVDVYKYYDDNGHLTGPARGSAGGFLISYLVGITHIDPIKYELSTSRFLTMDRVKQGNLPDIDCDLESREPLVGSDGNGGYLFERYGKRAAQVSTRTLLRVKSAILDANRFINGSVQEEVAALAKSLPNTPPNTNDLEFVLGYEDDRGNHIDGLIDLDPKLKKYSEEHPDEWDIVIRALSLSRQNSRHACAFVVADRDIEDVVPIMEVGGVKRVTQPEHKECEWAGLIKYDFLVVKQLQDIKLAIEYINQKNNDDKERKPGWFSHKGQETYIWDLPEEQDVFNMLSRGETESVFQLHSVTATPIVMDVRPTSVVDCAVITSLGRPGPLDFIDEKTGRNMAEEYAARKRGESKSDLPILDEMLPETYGVLVFQEQITKLAKELAGMNVEDAENVRIAVGKKKKKLIDSLKPIFVEGASKRVGAETANTVWDMMETFARYGFNKSHAVAYSVISYACAYLKFHYPLEWWAAVLSNAPDKEINELYFKYVKDLLLPPDVNTSSEKMEIDYRENKIRNKLSIIAGLGNSTVDKIIEGRPYKDIKDFAAKKVCGPSMAKKLIRVQVLDSLFPPNTHLRDKFFMYDQAVATLKWEEKLADYDRQIAEASPEDREKIEKRKQKYFDKGPKEVDYDDILDVGPKEELLIKKSIFPTMQMDLMSTLKKDSKLMVNEAEINGYRHYLVMGTNKFTGKPTEYRVFTPQAFKRVDESDVNSDVYFAVPGYIMDAKEFSYKNGSRKALKILIDSSGYVSEKVLWPDYNTGELIYPESLKKGSIAWFFYSKKAGKPYTNIMDIVVET